MGTMGVAGTNGLSALVRTRVVSPGTPCEAGGIALEVGLDADRSGILDDAEVDATHTQVVCNGAAGAAGPAGATGATGADGATGPQGPAGTPYVPPAERPTPPEVGTVRLQQSGPGAINATLPVRTFAFVSTPRTLHLTMTVSLGPGATAAIRALHTGALSLLLTWPDALPLQLDAPSNGAFLDSMSIVTPRNGNQAGTLELSVTLVEVRLVRNGLTSRWSLATNTGQRCGTDLPLMAVGSLALLERDERNVTSWTNSVARAVSLGGGGGSTTGRPMPATTTVTSPAPDDVVCFLERTGAGTVQRQVTLRVLTADAQGARLVQQQLQLEQAVMSAFTLSGGVDGLTTAFDLNFTRARWETQPITPQDVFGWDYTTNTPL